MTQYSRACPISINGKSNRLFIDKLFNDFVRKSIHVDECIKISGNDWTVKVLFAYVL